MSKEHAAESSKGKLKYFVSQAVAKCVHCQEISQKLDVYKEQVEKQQHTIIDILSEHKILLDRLLSQNVTIESIMNIFPINTEEKLKELDSILATQGDPYIRQMKVLIGGNAERNLHRIFGHGIIMNFNVDGTFGKRRLRDFVNVFGAIIDVISSFNETPDKTLRTAFQRQKKKYFKQTGRENAKKKVQTDTNDENLNE